MERSEEVMATGWVTDRSPADSDLNDDANGCVEVTYKNGLIGWEPIRELRKWKAGDNSEVVAWRKIRPAYKSKPA